MCSMLAQLDLRSNSAAKPNVIGNAEENEQISVTNLNQGKNKKIGKGIYNFIGSNMSISK